MEKEQQSYRHNYFGELFTGAQKQSSPMVNLVSLALNLTNFGLVAMMLGFFLLGASSVDAQTLSPGKLAAGASHTMAVNVDGTVSAWGYNNQGQLGNNTQTSSSVPVTVSGLTSVIGLAGGSSHSLAVKSDGTAWSWGYNANGQLGINSTTLSKVPVQVSSLTGVIAVASGASHSLAVKSDGTVWSWGLNTYGQLGNNSTTQSLVPVQVSGLTGVIAVAAGLSHSYALKSDGTVWSWGLNTNGQLGNNSTTQSLVPAQVSGLTGVAAVASGDNHGLIAKSDGTVWSWGYNSQGQLGDNTQTNRLIPMQVSGLTGMVSVSAGSSHSLAMKNDGTARSWGYNNVGQLGNNSTTLSKVPVTVSGLTGLVIAVTSGANHIITVMQDGAVWGSGQNANGQLGSRIVLTSKLPVQVSGLSSVMQVAGGANHTLSVKGDGTVWTSGYNNQGQLGNNTQINSSVPVTVSSLTGAIKVAGGASHSLALKSDGTVRSWGLNTNGQLGNNSTTLSKVPVSVSGLTSATAVSGGAAHSLALKSDGTVWTWGLNTNGQLGNNSTTQSLVPVQVTGLTGIVAVAAGSSHSLALKSDGTVWAWGLNTYGQLGNNSTTQSLVPVQVSGLTGITRLVAGASHSLALKSDGTVWTWGYNNQGQLGNNTQTNSLVPITVSGLTGIVSLAGGGSHSIALKNDGTVWTWGYNAQGQLGNNSTTLSKIPVPVTGMIGAVTVAAGTNYSMAGKEDGRIATWGDSPYGQLAEGLTAYLTSLVPLRVPAFNLLHAKPTVAITNPVNNATVILGQTQTVDVTFTAAEGAASSVLLYHQGILLSTDNVAPFSFSFQPWTYGDFSLTAEGVDSLGVHSALSTAVNLKVPFDSDLNGLPDWWELAYLGSLGNSPWTDGDGDGLTNLGEYFFSTSPINPDSDSDTILDGVEFATQYNATVSGLTSITANRTDHSVELQWVSTFPATLSVLIQKSSNGGANWTDVSTVPANTTGYVATGLTQNTSYQFRLVTVNSTSSSVSAQTLPASQLAAGSNHTLAVNLDGTVRAWGYNNQGQLGDNTQTSTSVPVTVSGLTGAISLAGGGSHSLALKSDGTVRSWGYNLNGQLGNNSTTLSKVPVAVSGLTSVIGVAAGASHSLAVKSDGTVWSWGLNTNGQLGNNSTTQSLIPVQVTGLTGVIAVAAGLSHSYALKSDGTVWTWGLNTYGQLGNNSTTQSLVPVQVIGLTGAVAMASGDNHGLVVKTDGTVWSWGYNNQGQLGDNTQTNRLIPVQVSGLTGMVSVSAGTSHSLALKSDGTLRSWGYNNVGQLGNNSTTLSKVPVTVSGISGAVIVAGGANHSVALKNDGSVWGTGQNANGQLGTANTASRKMAVQVSGVNSVLGVASGANHALSVKGDGTVWTWGYNNQGQLGNNTQINSRVPVTVSSLTGVVKVAGGASHSLALKSDGAVWTWGLNTNGQLGNNSTTLSKVPVTVSGLTSATAVSGGASHSLALKSDGTVWTWGLNTNGQLGNNSTTQSLVPVQVTGLTGVIAVAAGSSYSMALKSDGTVWAWGLNTYGQLGNNSTTQSLVPVQVSGLTGVVAIAAGSSHSLAVLSDGTVKSWGYNNQGQLGNNTQTNSLVPTTVSGLSTVVSLAGGGSHSVALKSDGTVWTWGYNNVGQLGNNSTTLSKVPVQVTANTTGVLTVTAGTNYCMVGKEDGNVATWGDALYGQLAEGLTAYTTSLLPLRMSGFNLRHVKPTVAISSPANNATLALGQIQTVDVTFTAAEGAPGSVFLYHQGMLLGTDNSTPFSFSFQPWTYGDFPLTVEGVDSLGVYSSLSAAVTVKTPFDSDLDGMPDWWEMLYFSGLSNTAYGDFDGDGLSNLGEYFYETLPNDADTDNDGITDGVEFATQYHQSPLDDSDHDRFPDIYETQMGGDPNNSAITPNTAHANFITVDPALPASVPNRRYPTIQAAVNAVATNAYGIVWIKPGTYQEAITITSRHIHLIADVVTGPVILKRPTSGGVNIITINSGSQDTVLDGLITTKTMNGATQLQARAVYLGLGNVNIGQSVAINNCLFKESSFGGSIGSALYIQSGTAWITHTTIVDNYSTYGQNIYLETNGKIRFRNSIVWNTSDPALSEFGGATNGSLADRIQVTNSIIRGGIYGANANNPVLRPVIQDIGINTSPANNSGAALDSGGVSLVGASGIDLNGKPRNFMTPDLGAYEFADTDGDGLPDWWETQYFGNLSQIGTVDSDTDGLTNYQEFFYNYNPTLADTDGDGENDLIEMLNGLDTDGDGMSDGFETQYSFDFNNPNDALEDADGDRIPNLFEDRMGRTNPRDALSKPAVSYTVDPSIVIETATTKKTITNACNAHYNNAGLPWAIITVKPGTYLESVSVSKSALLLAENASGPVIIKSPNSGLNALQIYSNNVVVDGFRITHVKTVQGCGVKVEMPTNPANPQCRLVNCKVFDNIGSKGAGIYVKAGILSLVHSTVAGNSSTSRSHGIALENLTTCKLQLQSSIVWNPEPPDYAKYGGTPIQMEAAPSQMLGSPSQNFILGGEWGALSSSPQLDPDYNLRSNSPAINPAGSIVNSASPVYDIHGETRDAIPDYGADEFRDSDSDGMADWWEVVYGAGLSMNPALDADGDGLSNLQEYTFGSLPTVIDSDADGATDLQEFTANSNPRVTDTDGDGMDDGYEINNLLNPNSIMDALEDPDGDRIPNIFEYGMGKTNPRNKLSRPATSLYVDSKIATETATTKKTIMGALNAYSVATSDLWNIIEVKQGFYEENLAITKSGILLLAEQNPLPTTINSDGGDVIGANWVNHFVLDGFRVTHTSYRYPGVGTGGSYIKTGGGISISGTGEFNQFKVVNCQIVGNTPTGYVTSPKGPGIYSTLGILTVANSTLAGNYTGVDGHAIFINSGAKLRLLNNIIWNIPPPELLIPPTVRQVGVEPVQLIGDATKNIIRGGELGALDVDPILDFNYRIRPGSPAINPSGSLPHEGVPIYDFNGEARDATPDYGPDEVIDSDADSLMDSWELFYFPALSTTTASADPDQDGVTNTWEEYLGLNPTLSDSDGNGLSDLQEALALVITLFLDATSRADQDEDGLRAIQETILGTSDLLADTNGDGLNDSQLVQFGFSVIGDDPDQDGLTTAQEATKGTSPFLRDTDGDGALDGVDVFPLDPSRSILSAIPGDVTAPAITLVKPANATLVP